MTNQNPYIKTQLKELDKLLNMIPKEHRLGNLKNYQYALETSFHESYPKRFSAPEQQHFPVDALFQDKGRYLGQQFGPLEAEDARETLLAEIEKRKARLTKTTTQRLGDFFSEFINKYRNRK